MMDKEPKFEDTMISSNDLEMIKSITHEILKKVDECGHEITLEDEFSYAWKLLENGQNYKQIAKILENLGNFNNSTSTLSKIKTVEKTLIKGQLLFSSPDFQSTVGNFILIIIEDLLFEKFLFK